MKEEIKEMYYQGFTSGAITKKFGITKHVVSQYVDEIIKDAKHEEVSRLVQIAIIEKSLFCAIETELLIPNDCNRNVTSSLQQTYCTFNYSDVL